VALSQMNDLQRAGFALPPIASLCHLSLVLSVMPGVLSRAGSQEVRVLTSGIQQWGVHAFC
jgi:hypothetical protein